MARKKTSKTTTKRAASKRAAGSAPRRAPSRSESFTAADAPRFRDKINRPDGTEFGRVGRDPAGVRRDDDGAWLVPVIDTDHHNHEPVAYVVPDEREPGAWMLRPIA